MQIKQSILKELRIYAFWITATSIAFGLTILILISVNDNVPNSEVWPLWIRVVSALSGQVITYVLAQIPYLCFVISRSIVRDFRHGKWRGLFKGFSLKIAVPVLLIWFSLQLMDAYRHGETFNYEWDHSVENTGDTIRNLYAADSLQRGIHVFDLLSDTTDLETLKTNNIEWLTIVPFISQEEYNTPSLRTDFGRNSPTDRFNRIKKIKRLADKYKFKIMLKPHIWLSNTSGGIWRSNITMGTEEDWKLWFQKYENRILEYAKIAEELNIELFCIGTELHETVVHRPGRWVELIDNIKEVYSGKLTYAANWSGEIENVPFWHKLDFIGVQAYFPIAENRNPSLQELEAGWEKHIGYLRSQHENFNKPILFTEIGYKTTPNAGIEPWEWDSFGNRFYRRISQKTQAFCYQSFFNVVWHKPWFAGAHIWDWQARGSSDGNDNSFTLEGKPAFNIVAEKFGETVK